MCSGCFECRCPCGTPARLCATHQVKLERGGDFVGYQGCPQDVDIDLGMTTEGSTKRTYRQITMLDTPPSTWKQWFSQRYRFMIDNPYSITEPDRSAGQGPGRFVGQANPDVAGMAPVTPPAKAAPPSPPPTTPSLSAGTEWWPDPLDNVQYQYWASVFLPGTASLDPQFAWYQESGTLWSFSNFSTYEQVEVVVPFLPCDLNLRENPYEKVTYRDPVTMEGMLSRVVSQITLNTAYIFNDARCSLKRMRLVSPRNQCTMVSAMKLAWQPPSAQTGTSSSRSLPCSSICTRNRRITTS